MQPHPLINHFAESSPVIQWPPRLLGVFEGAWTSPYAARGFASMLRDIGITETLIVTHDRLLFTHSKRYLTAREAEILDWQLIASTLKETGILSHLAKTDGL